MYHSEPLPTQPRTTTEEDDDTRTTTEEDDDTRTTTEEDDDTGRIIGIAVGVSVGGIFLIIILILLLALCVWFVRKRRASQKYTLSYSTMYGKLKQVNSHCDN